MATVRHILGRKGRDVVSLPPTATVLEAAKHMNSRAIGSVLVIESGRILGIFTERDVLRRVVAEQRAPATTTLREVMTTSLVTCNPDTIIEECVAMMTTQRVRHLPVIGEDGLAGLITSGDVLAHQLAEHAETIHHLQSYLFDTR